MNSSQTNQGGYNQGAHYQDGHNQGGYNQGSNNQPQRFDNYPQQNNYNYQENKKKSGSEECGGCIGRTLCCACLCDSLT